MENNQIRDENNRLKFDPVAKPVTSALVLFLHKLRLVKTSPQLTKLNELSIDDNNGGRIFF